MSTLFHLKKIVSQWVNHKLRHEFIHTLFLLFSVPLLLPLYERFYFQHLAEGKTNKIELYTIRRPYLLLS